MKITPVFAKTPYLRSLNSPLVRRISIVVFLCIISIEAVLLLASYFAERERLLTRIDHSLENVFPVLESSSDVSVLEGLIKNPNAQLSQPLLGLVFMSEGKKTYSVGDVKGLGEGHAVTPFTKRFDSSTGVYETYAVSGKNDSNKIQAWFRVDARQVASDLNRYIWRLFALELLISAFVTVGCVLALKAILLHPLMDLRLLMLATRKAGLGSIKIRENALNRQDELGDAYREFDRLQGALIEAEQLNQEVTTRFQHFADLGADCFWEVDRSLRFTFIAGDTDSLFGLSHEQILGERIDHLSELRDFPFPSARELVRSLMVDCQWEGPLEFSNHPDWIKTVRVVSKRMCRKSGDIVGIRGIVTNTTVASKLARDLNHLATHDVLTGLVNRRRFDELVEISLNDFKKNNRVFCVCVLDLDRFKTVNDSCGHAAGDKLLKRLADIISEQLTHEGVVSRYGGDEFTVLLDNCELDEAFRISEKIRIAIGRFRFPWEGSNYDVGASIGVAEMNAEFLQTSDVLRAADACCFKAKHLGRNQVQTYNPTDAALVQINGDLQWMTMITRSLEEGRFKLYQQPIRRITEGSRKQLHFEILLRMEDEEGRLFTPGSFLPAAVRYGLMDRLDRWVVKSIFEWMSAQEVPEDMDFLIHVNISDVSTLDSNFQSFLLDAISASGVDPKHFCFEVKETMVVQNIIEIADFLNEVRERGCKIALDDFGTGLSSLGYMEKLPVDFIKIDGVFIRDIFNNPLNSVLVKCIAEVASVLHICTVAEYVENEETLDLLADLGVDMAQGYLFPEPKPLLALHNYTNFGACEHSPEGYRKAS